MGWREQVCRRHGKPPYSYEAWLKKARARAERRRARLDAEKVIEGSEPSLDLESPRRRFRGYSD